MSKPIKPGLSRCEQGLEFLTGQFSAFASGLFFLALLGLLGAEIIMRNVFGRPLIFTFDFVGYFMAGFVTLGLSYTLRTKGHVSIEVVLNLLNAKTRRIVDGIIEFIILACSATLCYVIFRMLIRYFKDGIRSPSVSVSIPLYLTIIPVAIGMVLLCLASVLHIVRRFKGAKRQSALVEGPPPPM